MATTRKKVKVIGTETYIKQDTGGNAGYGN